MYLFFRDWVNKLFPEEYKVPTTLFEAWKVAGSAKCKQNKTVWNSVVLLRFVYTVMKMKRVFLIEFVKG